MAWILDAVGCSFFLLRRVCWPALEECYAANYPITSLRRISLLRPFFPQKEKKRKKKKKKTILQKERSMSRLLEVGCRNMSQGSQVDKKSPLIMLLQGGEENHKSPLSL
jgi:hypothetical protein